MPMVSCLPMHERGTLAGCETRRIIVDYSAKPPPPDPVKTRPSKKYSLFPKKLDTKWLQTTHYR